MMRTVIKKIIGFTLAGVGLLVLLVCLYLFSATRDWQWLFDALGCALFAAGALWLAIGRMTFKEFREDVLDIFVRYW